MTLIPGPHSVPRPHRLGRPRAGHDPGRALPQSEALCVLAGHQTDHTVCHPADADNYENDEDLLFTASSIQNVEIFSQK